MSNETEHFDLISMMVDETFKAVEEVDQTSFDNVLDFSKAKKTKINSEVEQLNFEFNAFFGAYDIERSCYVFQIKNETIELPKNWGPFKFINPNQLNNGELFTLSKSEDTDLLIDVLENISGLNLEEVKCNFYDTHFKLVLSEELSVAALTQSVA
jgi:hypothetical protein